MIGIIKEKLTKIFYRKQICRFEKIIILEPIQCWYFGGGRRLVNAQIYTSIHTPASWDQRITEKSIINLYSLEVFENSVILLRITELPTQNYIVLPC